MRSALAGNHQRLASCGMCLLLLAGSWMLWLPGVDSQEPAIAATTAPAAGDSSALPSNLQEARQRARILHETIHGALQVMHRDFFDDEQPTSIPSQSLEDVFAELKRSFRIELHWLAVNADALNTDHLPDSEFERTAVEALKAGEPEYAERHGAEYRFVGSIRLASQCLKCHLSKRTSLEDRVAGLMITMPLAN